jgi:hypothetical protein
MSPGLGLGPYGPGRPATFSRTDPPVGGGHAGHLEMAESLISTRLLEVISNRYAENGKKPGKLPLPNFQGHFHEYERGADG